MGKLDLEFVCKNCGVAMPYIPYPKRCPNCGADLTRVYTRLFTRAEGLGQPCQVGRKTAKR